MRRFIAFAILLVPLSASADDKAPASDAALKGKWQLTAAKFNGADSDGLKGRILVFEGGEFTTYDGDKKGRTVTYTLDPKADPKQIDLTAGGDGKKALGIYSVTKDELMVCYGEPGADRPTKFESGAGGRVFLLVLKRATD
jgi:uncharacterized protein (TIGR03067 family)